MCKLSGNVACLSRFLISTQCPYKKSTIHNPLGIYVGDKNKKDGLKATCILSKIRNNCLET